jgi:hypothetical protein
MAVSSLRDIDIPYRNTAVTSGRNEAPCWPWKPNALALAHSYFLTELLGGFRILSQINKTKFSVI